MTKAPTDIRSLARSYTVKSIKVLVGVMSAPDAAPAARVSAATALLDRGWGKPAQTTELTVRSVAQLTDAELAAIAAGSGDGTSEAAEDTPILN